MSKIALSSNVSGTGVLTITSPNTDTNRTLELPDASGKVYNQGSVVGTVSESSGIPTGAIVESGTNSNGYYVRWADGTQMCAFADTDLKSTGTSAGTLFSGGTTVYTFPAAFAYPPMATASFERVGGTITHVASMRGTTTTTVTLTALSGSSGGTGYLSYIAIGRWY